MPGSLDYLYHNGILDCIPYEAYEPPIVTPSGREHLAGLGTINPPIPNKNDIFVNSNSSSNKAKKSGMSTSDWVKGGLALGAIALTTVCLFKGTGAIFSKMKNAAFWTKLNPKNWFKK